MELPPVERSMEDVLAGLIRFTLGGRPFAMAVLPMGAHDRWEEGIDQSMQASFDAVPDSGPEFVKGIASAFRANRDRMLTALIAYDRDGVLPSRDDIRELATQQDIIFAIREVRAVGGDPLGEGVLSVLALPRTPRTTMNGSTPEHASSNGSPPSTTGQRRTSGTRLATNSSTSTSTPPKRVSPRRQK